MDWASATVCLIPDFPACFLIYPIQESSWYLQGIPLYPAGSGGHKVHGSYPGTGSLENCQWQEGSKGPKVGTVSGPPLLPPEALSSV